MSKRECEPRTNDAEFSDGACSDETAEIIEGIRKGLESMEKGEEQPAHEVFAELEAQFPFLRRQ